MAGSYFSSVSKLKIRRGGVVGEKDDIFSQPLVPRSASILEIAVLQVLKATSSYFRQRILDDRTREKVVVDGKEETTIPGRGMEDDGDVEDSQKAKRGRKASS
ncbi:hypothetical protein Fot_32168 [Forsythia ovata]|uniref:Uncharacterized protein n=1 Tax=Forsythia ovata TaxID=205694 RepID=A0ABD1T717_9LAMI